MPGGENKQDPTADSEVQRHQNTVSPEKWCTNTVNFKKSSEIHALNLHELDFQWLDFLTVIL